MVERCPDLQDHEFFIHRVNAVHGPLCGRLLSSIILALSIGCAVAGSPAAPPGAGRDWRAYLGNTGSTHYSTLDQIHRANVAKLQVAWTYETGDKGEFQANNLIVDGVLYTASPSRNVIALNAATGKVLWKFDPRTERQDNVGNRQRGLVYWEGAAAIDGSSRLPEPGSTRWTRGPACPSARSVKTAPSISGRGWASTRRRRTSG